MTVTSKIFVYQDVKNLWEVARRLAEIDALNFGRSGFSAGFIAREITSPGGVAVLLLDDGVVVGYTSAMRASSAYASDPAYLGRDAEGTAYVSNSSLHPDYQHQGHIWLMMERLEKALRTLGYQYLDRDSKSDRGYADKVVSHYGDRVVFAHPPEFTMWGQQRYIRVSL